MFGPGILIPHSGQFRFRVANGFMPLNHCIDSSFTLGIQRRDVLSCRINLPAESFGFRLSLGILDGGTFPFTREAFCLDGQTVERALELPRYLPQSLGNGSVFKQICSRVLNLGFSSLSDRELIGIRFFSRS